MEGEAEQPSVGNEGQETVRNVPEFSLPAKKQEEILGRYHPDIQNMLDLEQVFPYLNQHKLLTNSDQEELQSHFYTRNDKITKLVTRLPRKGSNALWRFIICLRSSTDGTAHDELANQLQSAVNEVLAEPPTMEPTRYNLFAQHWKVYLFIGMLCLLSLSVWFHSSIAYYLNLYHSKCLPYSLETFIGRGKEMEDVVELVDFDSSKVRITSIVGPPGIGKSTLAIHVGHDMVAQGVVVYYVDMAEVSSMQSLAEKVLDCDETLVSTKNVTVDRLVKWARDLHHRTLLILDNCDDVLHRQKETLQKTVKKLLGSSNELKVVMTSRQRAMQLNKFKMYILHELSLEASCHLLRNVTRHLNSTLCESIANLTGHVPLALQVVGALLNQPDPPDPMTVVHSLEKRLISTLSPAGLPTEERVNASISLSYHYLSRRIQRLGRYLANFPGSFTLETACEIMLPIARTPITYDYISTSHDELVQRSLLEYNQRSGRYQFHRLIREFFLDIQRSMQKVGHDEVVRFSKHFRLHYANELSHLSIQFQTNHKAALATLDAERHNIQHFLEEFEDSRTKISDDDYLSMIWAVRFSLGTRYLNSRFTPQEILGPLKAILIHMDNKLRPESPREKMPIYITPYIGITTHLARLEEELNGAEIALQSLRDHKQTVERMASYEILPDHDYTEFYIRLSIYYMAVEDYDGVRRCHAKILKYTKNELEYCSVRYCSYLNIGTAYFFTKSYEDSIYFLQLALEKQPLDTVTRAVSMKRLMDSYKAINDHAMVQEMLEEFTAIFPSLMSEPAIEQFSNNHLLQEIIKGYRDNGRPDEAFALEERQIEVIQEFGATPSLETVRKTKELVQHLLQQRNYSKAEDLARFGIESLKQLTEEQETHSLRLDLQIYIAQVKTNTGKFSEGLDDVECVVNFIYGYKNGPLIFAEQLSEVCVVAVFRLRFECVVGDRDVKEIVVLGGIKLVATIFELFLDLDVVEEADASQKDDQITHLSPSRGIATTTSEIKVWLGSLQLGSSLLHSWLNYAFTTLLANARWFIQFKVVRFVINVLWVIVKLILVYYILRCIRCCVCLPCKTVYFIGLVIELCVCLIATYLLNVV